jgi:hypothetical protein
VYDKIKKGLKKLPWWLKKALSYIPGLKGMIDPKDTIDPDEGESFEDAPKPKKKHWWSGKDKEEKEPVSQDVANDFIWRRGQGIQKFSSDDNMVSVKDNAMFDKIVGAMKGRSEGKDDDKSDRLIIGLQNEVSRLSMQLNNTSSALSMAMKSLHDTPPSSQPLPQSDLAGVADNAGDSRDPAYILRSRAWDRIRKGYVVI